MSAALKLVDTSLSLNDQILKVIDKAVVETFSSFMGFTPVLVSSEITDKRTNEVYEISGIIAFIQDRVEGTLAIRFRKDNILKLLSRIYGEELVEVDNRIIGGVAELANVIHGIAKEDLNLQGYNYQMCLPVVIIGDNHSMMTVLNGKKLIMKYDLDGQAAILELVLHN